MNAAFIEGLLGTNNCLCQKRYKIPIITFNEKSKCLVRQPLNENLTQLQMSVTILRDCGAYVAAKTNINNWLFADTFSTKN